MKRKITIIILVIILIPIGCICYLKNKQKPANNIILEHNITENQSTTKIPELYLKDEQILEFQETEDEGFELQGEIAYESGEHNRENIPLGNYAGLTYYSQIDSRWKNKIYTSIGNNLQTIGTSGCGPANAAMVVSSIKGTITPDVMANLYVEKRYRSANNGTYWSAFRWTADAFDIEYQETYSLDVAIDLVKNNNYIIVSCGNGLFTTGGHFITIVGIEGQNLKIYDSYLYSGKFENSTRRGKVTVMGNTIYCNIENFRKYSNYKGFFAFQNANKNVENPTNVIVESYLKSVKANGGLNVRSGPGTNYKIVNNLKTGTIVKIYETNNNWSKIGENIWVCSDYLYDLSEFEEKSAFNNYKVKVTANSGLNIRTGAGTKYNKIGGYSKNSIVEIIEEKNNWGKTNRGWICLDYTIKTNNSISKIFKSNTIIYSKSNLTGNKYYYLPNTKVKILETYGNIDKIQVYKTGRIGYVKNTVYK